MSLGRRERFARSGRSAPMPPTSKTDQEGEGLAKGIPYGTRGKTCPVLALRTWIRRAPTAEGQSSSVSTGAGRSAISLTAQYVSRILKKHARRVKEHSGHRSWQVFDYVKRAGTFQENPAKDVGL